MCIRVLESQKERLKKRGEIVKEIIHRTVLELKDTFH